MPGRIHASRSAAPAGAAGPGGGRVPPAHVLLDLQRRAGNRAVGQVLARRMKAGGGNQVMDFHDDPVSAFAHYTFNVRPAPTGKGKLLRDNDHLTIENSLAPVIAHLSTGNPVALGDYLRKRPEAPKKDHKTESHKLGYADVDNINFRPAESQQRERPAPAEVEKLEGVKPGGAKAEAVPVDQDVSLHDFLRFLRAYLRKMPSELIDVKRISQSVKTVVTRTGFSQDELFLNARMRGAFASLVLMTVRAAKTFEATNAPPAEKPKPVGLPKGYEWAPYTQAEPALVVHPKGYSKDDLPGLDEEIRKKIEAQIEAKQPYRVRQGEAEWAAVRDTLLSRDWARIKKIVKDAGQAPAADA